MFKKNGLGMFLVLLTLVGFAAAQPVKETSIGGKEHEMKIYGVSLGMDVSTALQSVFINAKRQPGQEKPDSKRAEGKEKKDIRVVYNSLADGEMQILFADGRIVKEIIMRYAKVKRVADLRLPNSSGFGEASSGERFDDRYTIGFVDNKKQEKLWWRDEKTSSGFQSRLTFLSGNLVKDTTMWWQTIVQKTVSVKPEDLEGFEKFLQKSLR